MNADLPGQYHWEVQHRGEVAVHTGQLRKLTSTPALIDGVLHVGWRVRFCVLPRAGFKATFTRWSLTDPDADLHSDPPIPDRESVDEL